MLAPTAQEHRGDEATLRELRERFLARLNGVLGGVLAGESFVLSQSYCFCNVVGKPEIRIEVCEGWQRVDQLDDTGAIYKNGSNQPEERTATEPREPRKDIPLDILTETLSWIDPSCGYERWQIVLAAIDASGGDAELARAWSAGELDRLDRGKPANFFLGDFDCKLASFRSNKPGGAGYGTLVHLAREAELSRASAAEAFKGYVPPPEQAEDDPPRTERRRGVRLIKGANSVARKVTWIWPGWLACGKLHLLAGGKGAGKSTLCFALAAALSVGSRWPDGSQAPLGDVLVWSAEDDFEDTILPRFLAAGGDPNRLYFVECMIGEDGEKLPFDPSRDMRDLIERAGELPDLKMVIIDPIVSAVSGDSHKNAETRRGLQPLVDFADQAGAALIGITHFTKGTEGKNPVERVTGSLAFAALARIVLAAAADEDGEQRRLVRVASNIGPSDGGIEYRLLREPLSGYDFSAQRVLWGAPLVGPAKELLESARGQSEITKASSFLLEALARQPVAVKELMDAAQAHGNSWPMIKRAKAKLPNIKASKLGTKWFWGIAPIEQDRGHQRDQNEGTL